MAHLLAAYDERPDGKMDIGEFRKLAQDMEARLATKPETGLIISDLGLASLVPEWRRMFDKSTVVTDVTAGVTVGCARCRSRSPSRWRAASRPRSAWRARRWPASPAG